MIDASLWQNEKFTRMPLGAQMLQIGIITHADDQGRVKARTTLFKMVMSCILDLMSDLLEYHQFFDFQHVTIHLKYSFYQSFRNT